MPGVTLIALCTYCLYITVGMKTLREKEVQKEKQQAIARTQEAAAQAEHERRLEEQLKKDTAVLNAINRDKTHAEHDVLVVKKKRRTHTKQKQVVVEESGSDSESDPDRQVRYHEKKTIVTELPSVSQHRDDDDF